MQDWIEHAKVNKPIAHAKGVYFSVEIYNDFVIKTPLKEKVKNVEALDFIADSQTYLSTKVKGVLPCYRHGLTLYMPRAPGILAKELADRWPTIRAKRDAIMAEIETHGYKLHDAGKQNIIVDGDDLYMIDFHDIRRVNDAGNTETPIKDRRRNNIPRATGRSKRGHRQKVNSRRDG